MTRQKPSDIERKRINDIGRVEFDLPDRIVNSSSREAYTPSPWIVRAGADDHLQYKSLEHGAV